MKKVKILIKDKEETILAALSVAEMQELHLRTSLLPKELKNILNYTETEIININQYNKYLRVLKEKRGSKNIDVQATYSIIDLDNCNDDFNHEEYYENNIKNDAESNICIDKEE